MKGAVLALFCAVALASAEINENGCPINPYVDELKPHPNCNKFYQCLQGDLFERVCASTLVFNVETQECDWPENVDCDNRSPPVPVSSEENEDSGNGNGNDDPSLAPEICAAEDSDGILVAHEDCNKFYQCHNGVPVTFACAPVNLMFNPNTGACDWPENVDCGNRIPGGDSDNGGGDSGDGGNGGGNGDGNGDNGNGEDNDNSGNGSGNNDPSLAPEICAAEDSDGILIAHEICNKFYQCDNGVPVERRCAPENLVFNPSTDACDWPENVDCGNRIPGGDGDSDNGGGDNGDGGNGGGNGDGNGDNGNGEDNDNSGNGSGNNDPSLAPEICAAEDSDGILVAHEICNKFYQCDNGVPVERRCAPENLVFNPSTDACDWPENVDCGNRIPGGDGDSDNGGGDNGDGGNDGGNGDGNGDNGNGEDNDNSGNGSGNNDPSLAPEICAAEDSDGILIAHEICNKFYQCDNGVPVERRCAPENLVFNPSTDACDWPENVDCGNRIPGGDGDSDNGGGDNGDGGNDGGNGDGNGDNGNGEDNDNSGNGSGNNDPSLAPEICAAEDSDGILIAHEICNKFYQCDNGVPVERRCAPENLVFNPSTDACDWPENVDCGNRIPGGDGDSDNGGGDNGDGGNGGGNGDSNGDNGNGEDNDNSGNGSGNNDPSLAPEICAAEDSDGILVAHEICNKFYQCDNGVPVERRCAPENLVFNPSTDACDWPENVDCGNRIPGGDGDSDNGGGDNGDGGNDGGNGDGNGDNGNGEDNDNSGNGSGNNDPSLAPEICAAEDSDGILIAHEICNKFYQCDNGVPVERRCAPENLVFNPSTDACDWPENVDCGNRIPGGDGDSDNGGGDNGDGGNDGGNGDGNGDNGNGEDNDNSGNGSGNNDPSLAPEICAAEDSDGILVAHEICNKFYQCDNGVPVERRCAPENLVFNPSTDACDWPENVDCGNRIPGGDGDSDNGGGDNGNGGNDGGNGDGNGDNGNGEDNDNSGNGSGNNDPSLAPEICAAEDSDGILIAHEICNKFYQCDNGVPVERRCAPENLVFNPSTDACDWPENVDCGNRIPGGDGDSDNGGGDNGDGGNGGGNGDSNGDNGNGEDNDNSGNGSGNNDPSLAPEICAAEDSDGILVAHEICNKFYQCDNGVPVERRCAPENLVFNPSTDACDWPENVDCGNRIPGGDGDSDNGGGDNGDGGNDGGNGDGNGDNGNGEDNDNSGNGSGNNDPSLAPEICAAEDSDGILIAHEICNKFYQCDNGVPVERRCAPENLVFNPSTDACDWPENVDCGNRIPGGDGDSDNGGGDNGDGGNDGGNGDGNGDNGNGEDNDNSGNGSGNNDPSLAPEICAAEDSDGILIAHEICNKFYQCDNGVPVERRCAPENLVFNPSTDACDWPENVDCGNRIPGGDGDSDNGGGDNGDGGNDGGNGDGNGDNGNGEDNDNSGNGSGNNDPSLAPEICAAEDSDGILIAHEICNKFYQCDNGVPVERRCAPENLVFNPSTDACDWPENVDCGNRIPGGDGDSDNGGGDNGDGGNDGGNGDGNGDNGNGEDNDNSGNGSGNNDPSLAPEICAAEDSDGILIAHEICNKFYQCDNGVPVERRCAPENLVFNPSTDACDWPENVDCGNRIPGGDGDSDNGGGDNGDGGNDGGNGDGNGDNGNGEDNDNSGNGSGNNDPSLAPEICAEEDSDGILVAHEICNKFYQCDNGVPVERRCAPENLVFNPSTDACDWPENVDCGNRIPGGDGDSDNGGGDNGDGGNDGGNGDGNGDNGNGEDNDNSGNGSGNNDPSLAPEICAAEDSDGILIAHEICNKFYQCDNGVPVERRCAPENLVFNPSTDACDWPENVDCGNRIPGGDGDSDNGGGDNGDGGNGGGNGDGNGDNGNGEDNDNSGNGSGNNDPSLAPEICAAEDSDGILVAHENCNQFYVCSEGKSVVLSCPINLLFNPSNDQCDWPENVNCDGRNTDGGNGGNGENGNGDGDNGNNAGGGNTNPSEAPEICAAESSDGVLVAHENCNQFYKCSEGRPVVLNCPLNLLFNPSNDQCDWPENVNCDGRNKENGSVDSGDSSANGSGGNTNPGDAPKICAAEGSDGTLVAHENCNQFYKCSEGLPVALDCPLNLLFNPNNNQCDWPENVNCDGRNPEGDNGGNGDGGNGDGDNGESGSGGNSDPSEAPEICAAEGSDGILVAHENCNQFYVCSEGLPVALDCPLNLLFNPNNNQCDWPENVNCDGRNPDGDNGGNGDGGNGDGENGESGSGGNSDPSEAPEICAVEGSDGILVAHENCNQFYVCSEGSPVALDCPLNLLFNPTNDQCDWPENVDCGNRHRFTSFNKHMRYYRF